LVPQPPFAGDASMFDAKSDTAKVAVRVPGARIEMAAVPIDGWSAVTGLRWLIWAIAIPVALLASARLLLVFFGMPSPVLRVYTGLLMVLVGGVLALLRQDMAAMLAGAGIGSGAVVTPVIVALVAFATAYTINAALSAFVWPEQPVGRVDSLQRAPSILRHFLPFCSMRRQGSGWRPMPSISTCTASVSPPAPPALSSALRHRN
jgi:hypothetical protein